TQPAGDEEARGDGDPVKERMNHQSEEHRIAPAAAGKLFRMGLFAEVEMAGERMLKEMDQKISRQQQQRRPRPGELDAFRQHLQKGSAKHETGAKSAKIAQVTPPPGLL